MNQNPKTAKTEILHLLRSLTATEQEELIRGHVFATRCNSGPSQFDVVGLLVCMYNGMTNSLERPSFLTVALLNHSAQFFWDLQKKTYMGTTEDFEGKCCFSIYLTQLKRHQSNPRLLYKCKAILKSVFFKKLLKEAEIVQIFDGNRHGFVCLSKQFEFLVFSWIA